MRYENKTMKSDKPTREKYVFCNEKSQKTSYCIPKERPLKRFFLSLQTKYLFNQ